MWERLTTLSVLPTFNSLKTGVRGECPVRRTAGRHSSGRANDSFSNWAFGSSSFSFFFVDHCHSSGSRFSSQSG